MHARLLLLFAGTMIVGDAIAQNTTASRRRAVRVEPPARVHFAGQVVRLQGLDGEVAVRFSMGANFRPPSRSIIDIDGESFEFTPSVAHTRPSRESMFTFYGSQASWSEEIGFYTTGDHVVQIVVPGPDSTSMSSPRFIVPVWPTFSVFGMCTHAETDTVRIRFQARYFEYAPPPSVAVEVAGVPVGRAVLAETFKDNISPVQFGNYDLAVTAFEFRSTMVALSASGAMISTFASENGVPAATMRYAYMEGKDFYADCSEYPTPNTF